MHAGYLTCIFHNEAEFFIMHNLGNVLRNITAVIKVHF